MFNFINNLNSIELLVFLFFIMIFLHIIADYIVQNNFMATYKQKKNWEEYTKEGKYIHDYKIILLIHAFSWSFITFFPILIYTQSVRFWIGVILLNTIFHAVIDDSKCNDLSIDLVIYQILHIGQIIVSLIMAFFMAL